MNRKKIIVTTTLIALQFLFGCSRLSNPTNNENTLEPSIPISDNPVNATEVGSIDTTDDFPFLSGLGKRAFLNGSYKWHYRNLVLPKQAGKLYWCLSKNCADGIDAKPLIREAFAVWQPYVPFTFTEVSTEAKANIVIRFLNTQTYTAPNYTCTGVNGCREYEWNTCAGKNLTTAVHFVPWENSLGLGFDFKGDAYINDYSFNWKYGSVKVNSIYGPFKVTLRTLLMHTVGHLMGLDHAYGTIGGIIGAPSTVPYNIMVSGAQSGATRLYDDDIYFITRLYDFAYQIVFDYEHTWKIMDTVSKVLPGARDIVEPYHKLFFNRFPSKCKYDYRQYLIDAASNPRTWEQYQKNAEFYVPAIYKILLGRAPSTTEKNSWITKLKAGTARVTFVNAIVVTSEWSKKYITDTYKRHLNRIPSGTELTLYTNPLTNGKITPWEIEYKIIKSPEYLRLCSPATPAGLVHRAYTTLDCKTTSNSYDAWINTID